MIFLDLNNPFLLKNRGKNNINTMSYYPTTFTLFGFSLCGCKIYVNPVKLPNNLYIDAKVCISRKKKNNCKSGM